MHPASTMRGEANNLSLLRVELAGRRVASRTQSGQELEVFPVGLTPRVEQANCASGRHGWN